MSSEDFVVGIAFDIEATGCRPIKHGMIELGAVALNTSSGVTLDRFSVEIQLPPNRTWEQRCLDEFWDNKSWEQLPDDDPNKAKKKETYERLQRKRKRVAEGKGETPEKAMKDFLAWIAKMYETHAKKDRFRMKFLSDTVSFDSNWVNNYLDEYADSEPLHLLFKDDKGNPKFDDVLCTSDVARGLSCVTHEEVVGIKRKLGWYDRDETCREKLGIPNDLQPDAEHNHDAVSDAEYIGKEHIIQMNWAAKHQRIQ
jgi:DNA polymerase III epsilon subunit-like protein